MDASKGDAKHPPPVELASDALVSDAASITSSEDDDWMTQSQFAQVVFHEVADSYPNDCALLCRFTLTDLVEASPGDRVGIYRVPHVAAHEYTAFEWVISKTAMAGSEEQALHSKKDMQVEFKGTSLPKDEDFYQFQYLRGDNSVIGASIPFQLRSPKSEELCAVEDDEEFMVVRSNSAHVSEQYKDRVLEMERKYTDLLSLSERLNEEKCQSFILLDEQCRTLVDEQSRCEQLKRDLALVLKNKVELEKLHHKALNDLEKMTNKMEAAITEQDNLRGKIQKTEQEKYLHQEDCRQQAKKADDLNSMLIALAKSKELAVGEIKAHILQRDQCAREVLELKQALEREKAANANAKRTYESLLAKFEEQKREIIALKATEEEAAKRYSAKEVAFRESEKSLEKQNQALKLTVSELSDAIDTLEARLRRSEREQMPATVMLDSTEYPSGCFENVDYHSLYETGQNRIVKLETMLKDLQVNLRTSEVTHASEIKTLRDDLDQLRSRSYVPSESSSTRNLDSIIIQNAIESAAAEEQNRYNDNISHLGATGMRNCQLCSVRPFPDTLQDYLTHLTSSHYFREISERYRSVTKFDCLDCLFVGSDLHDLVHHRGSNHEEVVDFVSSEEVKAELRRLGGLQHMSRTATRPKNRNLDSLIIQNAAEFANLTGESEDAFPSDNSGQGFQPPLSYAYPSNGGQSFRAPSPLIPCSPPTQARSPMIRAQNGAHYNFLPQFPGSVMTQMPHQPQQESALPMLLLQSLESSQNSDLVELAAWAESGNVSSSGHSSAHSLGSSPPPESSSSESFALTDDGRPIAIARLGDLAAEAVAADGRLVQPGQSGGNQASGGETRNDVLTCPVCSFTYPAGQVRELEFHVESHLATSNSCPVCQHIFGLTEIEAFERHVQEHFAADEFSMVGSEEMPLTEQLSTPAPPRNPFEAVGHVASNVASSIRNWTLEID